LKSPLVIEESEKKEETKEEVKVDIVEVEKKIKQNIPVDYIPIKLESHGMLTAPKVLHFRDYTMDDALQLNILDEEDRLKAIVTVLNNMCYEDFDCRELHPKELTQILYTVHGSFIGSKLEKNYYIDDTLEEGREKGQKDNRENIASIEIDIHNIKTQSLLQTYEGKNREKKFKEPFTIVDHIKKNQKIQFRLTRIKDILFTQEYCKALFFEEEKEYSFYKKQLLKIRDIKEDGKRDEALEDLINENDEKYKEYMNFLNKRDSIFVKVLQSQLIEAIDDEKLDTIEKKLYAYEHRISATLWSMYDEIIDEYNFGIVEEVTFFSDKLNKNITRKFPFQFIDFLPDSNKNYSRRYTVEFN
jgi:hypothetical protein